MERLILDTGILVAVERGKLGQAIAPGDDVAIAAVTLAELMAGAQLGDPALAAERSRFAEELQRVVAVEPYDARVAACHATLLAHCRRAGKPRGAHDLIIAATAIATSRRLLTLDRNAAFGELPGVVATELG